jgi:hypothetical protein
MSAVAGPNMLVEEIQYQVEETPHGVWRRYLYPTGARFAEFKSHLVFGTLPLVHYTFGKCPETGKRITARGVVAIGRFARGMIAIGQVSMGLVAVGQLSLGLIFCVSQAAFGAICIGQLAAGLLFGLGQFATGYIAIGQLAYGTYVLAQLGWGTHVVDMKWVDPVAKNFFLRLIGK